MNDGTIYNCQSCFPAASRLCHLRQRFGQSSYPVIKLEPQYLNYHCQGEKIWLTHFKKVTRTICLKFVFDHKIDILEPDPLIHKKVDQRQKSSLAIRNGFQTASTRMKKDHFIGNLSYAGADPGLFLGGGALVSCSTSTPTNHIVLFFFAEYQLY